MQSKSLADALGAVAKKLESVWENKKSKEGPSLTQHN